MEKKELLVVCDTIRSTHNVGSIFRTADGAGVSKLFLCGITPLPPRPDINKVSLGAEKSVPFEHRQSTLRLIKQLKQDGYQIIALENGDRRSIDFRKTKVSFPAALIVGSEVSGIDSRILTLCDSVISIPMHGAKESLNVSVAFGIAVYQLLHP